MRLPISLLIMLVIVTACQPTDDDPLPTIAQVPSATVTDTVEPSETPIVPTDTPTNTLTPTDTATATATVTPDISSTPSNTPTETLTPTNTFTPTVTLTPSPDVNATRGVERTATQRVVEAPVFSTFTPLPPGVAIVVRPTSTGTPQVVADVIITEAQLQEEVNRILSDNADISRVVVRYQQGGVDIELTARNDGGAFITGTFFIEFIVDENSFNNFLVAQPSSPDTFRMNSGGSAPESFVDTAFADVTPAVFEAFDFILNQRLGQGQHNLEQIFFQGNLMGVSLLVPEPAQ